MCHFHTCFTVVTRTCWEQQQVVGWGSCVGYAVLDAHLLPLHPAALSSARLSSEFGAAWMGGWRRGHDRRSGSSEASVASERAIWNRRGSRHRSCRLGHQLYTPCCTTPLLGGASASGVALTLASHCGGGVQGEDAHTCRQVPTIGVLTDRMNCVAATLAHAARSGGWGLCSCNQLGVGCDNGCASLSKVTATQSHP